MSPKIGDLLSWVGIVNGDDSVFAAYGDCISADLQSAEDYIIGYAFYWLDWSQCYVLCPLECYILLVVCDSNELGFFQFGDLWYWLGLVKFPHIWVGAAGRIGARSQIIWNLIYILRYDGRRLVQLVKNVGFLFLTDLLRLPNELILPLVDGSQIGFQGFDKWSHDPLELFVLVVSILVLSQNNKFVGQLV